MIPKDILSALISQKLKDVDVLIANRRYSAAMYLAGYAVELALRLKIRKIFKFEKGFPENKAEFSLYQNSVKSQKLLVGAITQLRDIRNHDLNRLLFFSGVEYTIKSKFLNEWNLVFGWDPEIRYKLQKVLKKEAVNNVEAIKIIVKNIL